MWRAYAGDNVNVADQNNEVDIIEDESMSDVDIIEDESMTDVDLSGNYLYIPYSLSINVF